MSTPTSPNPHPPSLPLQTAHPLGIAQPPVHPQRARPNPHPPWLRRRRTPCSGTAAARARRCPSRRTPCRCTAAARARRDAVPAALLAAAPLPPVLADPLPAALFAMVLPPPVRAAAFRTAFRPAALVALAPLPPVLADARAAVPLPPLLTGPDVLGTHRDDRQCRRTGSRLRDRRVLLSQRLPDLHHRRGCGRTLRPCQRERRVHQQAGRHRPPV